MPYNKDDKVFSFLATTKRDLTIKTSMDAYEKIHPYYCFGIFTNYVERFFALLIDQELKPLDLFKVSTRNQPFVEIDIGEILDKAKSIPAISVVITRSSVSNNTNPTNQDNLLVQVISDECTKQQLKFQDYLIISEYGMYFSYADNVWKTTHQINNR
jgi:DNA repair protein RadC